MFKPHHFIILARRMRGLAPSEILDHFDDNVAHENNSATEQILSDVTNTFSDFSDNTSSTLYSTLQLHKQDQLTEDIPKTKMDDTSSKNKSISENVALTNQVVTRLRNSDDIEQRDKFMLSIMNIFLSPK